MINKILTTVAVVAALGAATHGQAQISLTIDGRPVVPAGQIETILYQPDSRELVVRSVHADWRCTADPARNTPTVEEGDFRLVLDQINPLTEPGAVYRIASPLDGGSIIQNLADGVLEIQTTDDTSIQLTCAPFRESFSSNGFEVPLRPSAEPPESPFLAGSTLVVPVTVRNVSKSLVATGIDIELGSSIAGDAANVGEPTFSGEGVIDNGASATWSIGVLFPQEERTANVSYAVGAQTAPGTVVTTSADVIGALNRAGTAPLTFGNPDPRTWAVTIGEAEGDLTASMVTGNAVAGSGTGNLTLSHRVTNNAVIGMTDIVVGLDTVSLPAGVAFESENASLGGVSAGVWTIPSLASGQTATLDRDYTVAADSAAGGQVCGGLTITSAGENLVDTGDDAASGCSVVEREVDIGGGLNVVQPSFNATSVNAGATLRYGVSVNNAGPSNASSVAASLALSVQPDDSNVIIDGAASTTSDGGFSNATGRAIDFDVSGQVPPSAGRSADIEIDVPPATPDGTQICLSISAFGSAEPDTDPADLPPASCVSVVNTGT